MREKLDYIYYRFYRFQASFGNGLAAVSIGLLFLSFLLLVNFFSVVNFLYGVTGIKIPIGIGTIMGMFGPIGIIVVNYFLFIYRKRYKGIIKKYEKEGKPQLKKGNLIVIGYFILTFLLLALSFYTMIRRNDG